MANSGAEEHPGFDVPGPGVYAAVVRRRNSRVSACGSRVDQMGQPTHSATLRNHACALSYDYA